MTALVAAPRLEITFFNQSYRGRQLPPGTLAAFSGKVSLFRGRPQMTNPDVEVMALRRGGLPGQGGAGPLGGGGADARPGSGPAMRNALDRARPITDPLPPERPGAATTW